MDMKRFLSLLLILCLGILTGCACRHEWAEPSCTAPAVCNLCGETEGEALGHAWADATCEAPKSCTRCALEEGDPLGHDWVEASCETAKVCSRCALQEGEPLGHSYENYTCDAENFTGGCVNCAAEQTLSPEDYARQVLVGTWDTVLCINESVGGERTGDTVSFDENGIGTLSLPDRLFYPKTVILSFSGFAHQESIGTYSMDFDFEGYMLDEWDAFDYNEILKTDEGIYIRLHIPDGSGLQDAVSLALVYKGYSAYWVLEKTA